MKIEIENFDTIHFEFIVIRILIWQSQAKANHDDLSKKHSNIYKNDLTVRSMVKIAITVLDVLFFV